MLNLTSKSGKYRVEQNESGHLRVYRHGELWLDSPEGAKLLIELCYELEELREAAAAAGRVEK